MALENSRVQQIESHRTKYPQWAASEAESALDFTDDILDKARLGRIWAVSQISLANHHLNPKLVRSSLVSAHQAFKTIHLNSDITYAVSLLDSQTAGESIAVELKRDLARWNLASSSSTAHPEFHLSAAAMHLQSGIDLDYASSSSGLAQVELMWLDMQNRKQIDRSQISDFSLFCTYENMSSDRRIDAVLRTVAIANIYGNADVFNNAIKIAEDFKVSQKRVTKEIIKTRASIARNLVMPYLFKLTHTSPLQTV